MTPRNPSAASRCRTQRRPFVALLLLISCATAGFTVGCDQTTPQEERKKAGGKPLVMTTFYPTTYFATRILGDLAEVRLPVPDGEDPIFWNPPAEQITEYQGADLIIVNGAGFEKWVEKVTLPESLVVDSAYGFHHRFLNYEGAVTHSHGPQGEHSHEGLDGHTWLAPELAVLQVKAISKACERLLPKAKQQIAERTKALVEELEALDAEFAALKLPPVLASHPAYNYIARQYSWKVQNLDLDPETVLTSDQSAEVRGFKDQLGAQSMLWEGEPSTENVQLLEKLGIRSLLFSPCEMPPGGDADYLTVMRQNLVALRQIAE